MTYSLDQTTAQELTQALQSGEKHMKTKNLLLDTDSYKYSHWAAYPPELTYLQAYGEARQKDLRVRFVGLQNILLDWVRNPITRQDIEEARELANQHFGRDDVFHYEGFLDLVRRYHGHLPLKIEAIPEGTVLSGSNLLYKVTNTDPAFAWLVTFVESQLMRVWGPTTVASNAYQTRQLLRGFLRKTTPEPEAYLDFMLHDFGVRGVVDKKVAAINGLGHLTSFHGTDNVPALELARTNYGTDMAAYSIPALEHSTILAWGKDREADCFANFLRKFGRRGQPIAMVMDTYDVDNAISNILGVQLREQIIDSGVALKVRLDSGDPVESVTRGSRQLAAVFGTRPNELGFEVFNHGLGVVQGNKVTDRSITNILTATTKLSFCASNYVFGQGGGLLQAVNRDDQGHAYKPSLITYQNGRQLAVCKTPKDDPFKASKAGDLDVVQQFGNGFVTIDRLTSNLPYPSQLRTVYEKGKLPNLDTLDTIRTRA